MKEQLNHRLDRLTRWLNKENLDGVLLYSRENARYFTGFTGTESTALVMTDRQCLYVDSRYTSQAAQQCPGYEVVDTTMTGLRVLKDAFVKRKGVRIGVEDDALPLAQYNRYREFVPDAEFLPAGSGINRLRSRKDESEIRAIREAVRLADQAFTHILGFIRPGVAEREVALELEFAMRREGASGLSFDTIVASGVRSALPHGVATGKLIESGDAVVLDFGCRFEGYCSDMTRTVFVGPVLPELAGIYETVLSAQQAAEQALRSGMTGAAADGIARDVICDAGYGEHFGHSLGHGVGLAIHEEPRLSRTNPCPLEPGDVVTVEPGIYLPGTGGVRIEDMAVIREDDAEILTASDRSLIRL